MEQSKNLTEAIDRLAKRVEEPLDRVARLLSAGPSQLPVFSASLSEKHREHLIITYTVGTLKFAFKEKTLYGLLDMQQFDLDGRPNGHHQTVWQPLQPADELVKVPFSDFEGPFNIPSAIESAPMRANSKAVWRFRDGDEIRATGPANSMIVPFSDKSQLFCVSVAAILTGGSGKYKGCRGVKTALGSSFLRKGVSFEDLVKDPNGVGGVTVEAFRVVLQDDM